MARQQLKTLTEQMYYILLSLQTENFGYQMMEDIQKMTGGRVVVGAGSFYRRNTIDSRRW